MFIKVSMRIETDYIFLMYLGISLVLVWGLLKIYISKKVLRRVLKIALALNVALLMPAFIPGHGEVVMLIPTGALYGVSGNEVKFLGLIFTLINYAIVWYILYKVMGLYRKEI